MYRDLDLDLDLFYRDGTWCQHLCVCTYVRFHVPVLVEYKGCWKRGEEGVEGSGRGVSTYRYLYWNSPTRCTRRGCRKIAELVIAEKAESYRAAQGASETEDYTCCILHSFHIKSLTVDMQFLSPVRTQT